MRYTIQTRQNSKGSWWCNGTICGYDHSFEGPDMFAARCQMKQLLRDLKIRCYEVFWEQPKTYQAEPLSEMLIKSQTTRLTH